MGYPEYIHGQLPEYIHGQLRGKLKILVMVNSVSTLVHFYILLYCLSWSVVVQGHTIDGDTWQDLILYIRFRKSLELLVIFDNCEIVSDGMKVCIEDTVVCTVLSVVSLL